MTEAERTEWIKTAPASALEACRDAALAAQADWCPVLTGNILELKDMRAATHRNYFNLEACVQAARRAAFEVAAITAVWPKNPALVFRRRAAA